jgi:hypothetical protein
MQRCLGALRLPKDAPDCRSLATMLPSFNRTRLNDMAERTADVQAHWTRPGVLARIDAALTELGHDPQNLSPDKLTNRLILGDDAPERQRNSQRNLIERRTIYWMITAERPKL